MSKDEIIDLIDNRIKSEHRKHKGLDFSIIAAHKIYASLEKIFNPDRVQKETKQTNL